MTRATKSIRTLLVPALALALGVACQTGPKVETEVRESAEGVVVVQTLRLQATVVAIQAHKASLTGERLVYAPESFELS